MALHYFKTISIMMIMLSLCACASVKQVEYQPVQAHAEDATTAPIKFTRLRVELPVGAEIGQYRNGCLLSFQKVGRGFLNDLIHQKNIDDTFAQTLEMQGYDIVNRLTADFDEEYANDWMRSEYKVSAKIIDAQIDACEQPDPIFLDSIILGLGGYHGKLYVKVQWAVYDNLRRKVVYKTVTEGSVNRPAPNIEGLSLMMTEAFDMAAHNLGADQPFHDLMFYGEKPPQEIKGKHHKRQSRPRVFDPQGEVVINNMPLSHTSMRHQIGDVQKIAVLIQAGAGHGSGFFITDQGHILTNAHVIGDAMRVRVVTAGKEEKFIAEVLRRDPVRDVALLRLEHVPHDLHIIRRPIKMLWPAVSEDIYALGAPRKTSLEGTLTKGIVSAHRKGFKIFGTKVDLIQGDVAVNGGNSGGPLLDAYGNIVGITVAGYGDGDIGLNMFIPIQDALDHVRVGIE